MEYIDEITEIIERAKEAEGVQEKVQLSREEKLDLLVDLLDKNYTLSDLCEILDSTEYEIIGFTESLKDEGYNITVNEKQGKTFLTMEDYPDISEENVYHFNEDINEPTKIGVIADLRFGSKNEQLAILNDIYTKFAKDGVKHVFVGGNIIEGEYKGQTEKNFSNSLYTNDVNIQADLATEYFPKIEGINTYFITGSNEQKCGNILNVGEYIASKRPDMKYLGPKRCVIKFNDVSIKLEQLKSGKAYTVSYPAHTYSRSMSSYEDYDIVLLSGALNAQNFPNLRDSQTFTIPSVVKRTPKMNFDQKVNDIGAIELEITYTNKGKLKRLVPTFIPYYVPTNKTYLTTPILDATIDDNKDLINARMHPEATELDKFYSSLKKEQTLESLELKTGRNKDEIRGMLAKLIQSGREISIQEENGELIVNKYFQKRTNKKIKPYKEELHKEEIFVASDTHFGSIYSQPSFLHVGAKEAYNRGITTALHVGDVSDGDYHTIRPNHVKEVFLYGATGQINYSAETIPKYEGLNWYFITGSHDQTHQFNYGVDFGEELEKLRPDLNYLGQDRGTFMLDNCEIELFHPGGGSSKILSTTPQNRIDQLESGTKPNISLVGHYHKMYYMLYRNIHTILVPCCVAQSSFMLKQGLANMMGCYFVTIYYDDKGYVHYFEPEAMVFNEKDVRENDWAYSPNTDLNYKLLTPEAPKTKVYKKRNKK